MIIFGEWLYFAKWNIRGTGRILCQEVIDRIPTEKRSNQSQRDSGGIDVHLAIGERGNFRGCYDHPIDVDEFLFSISEQTAMKYLPKLFQDMIESREKHAA